MIEVSLSPSLETLSFHSAVSELVAHHCASRLFASDATLWGDEAHAEASVRLGWVDPFAQVASALQKADRLRDQLHHDGVHRVIVCGMGGSSLAPEVLARRDRVGLTVVDSTHPDQVRRALDSDLEHTVVVVSSKSGTTVETQSHLALFAAAFQSQGIDASSRIVIVTDPDSALHLIAAQEGYACFLGDPNVGGRFSALTVFGLVPFVLAGGDAWSVIAEAQKAQNQLRADSSRNPAILLAAACVSSFPDVHTIALYEPAARNSGIADWIEQLVAESTGKDGVGILPLVLDHAAPELVIPRLPNVLFIELETEPPATQPQTDSLAISAPLGAQFLLWETAVALVCRLIGVNPFDQPDVESAKVAARLALEADGASGDDRSSLEELVRALRCVSAEGGYVSVQGWVDRHGSFATPLRQFRARLAEVLRVPVTLGWGPRYLHSTGQLHKGGFPNGTFLQVVQAPEGDLSIPPAGASSARLMYSQAEGDRTVLRSHGRPVLSIDANSLEQLLLLL